ncbi:hypothetical protein [Lactovum odontotermitis]
MKDFVCKNCGSSSFHKVGNDYVCDYCKTVYVSDTKYVKPKELVVPLNKAEKTAKQPKAKKKKRLGCSVFVVIVVLWGAYQMFGNSDNPGSTNYEEANSAADSGDSYSYEEGTIDDVAGWSKEIYKKVVIATENYNDESGEFTYTGGMSYDELLKTVGNPSSTTSYSAKEYSPARTDADWDLDKNGDYASANVSVTYDNKTRMIISKNCYPDIDE